jgi:hypothetical protein
MTYSAVTGHGPHAVGQRKWLRTRRAVSVFAGGGVIFLLSSVTDMVLESMRVFPTGPLFDTGLLLLATAYHVASACWRVLRHWPGGEPIA